MYNKIVVEGADVIRIGAVPTWFTVGAYITFGSGDSETEIVITKIETELVEYKPGLYYPYATIHAKIKT